MDELEFSTPEIEDIKDLGDVFAPSAESFSVLIHTLPQITRSGDYHIIELAFNVNDGDDRATIIKRFKIKTSTLADELKSSTNAKQIPVLEDKLKRLRELSGISHSKNYV